MILIEDFSIRFIIIFMNIKWAIKKETKPKIKFNSPKNNKKTSPKKEKSKARIYTLLLLLTESEYKTINDNNMSGLKSNLKIGIWNRTPITSKTATLKKTIKAIFILFINNVISKKAIYNFCLIHLKEVVNHLLNFLS